MQLWISCVGLCHLIVCACEGNTDTEHWIVPSHCVCLWKQYRHGALDCAVSLYVPMKAIQTRSTGLCRLIVCL